MADQKFKVRRAGVELPEGLTMSQIQEMDPAERDDMEVYLPQVGWAWPNKWISNGDDIEVAL